MKPLFITLLAASALAAAADPARAQEKKGRYEDTYRVLTERNMFLRNRPRPVTRDTTPRAPRPNMNTPEMIERSLVLRGVAIEDDELHAYLENIRSGQLTRVAPGETLASGRVAEIAIDAIAYEIEGRATWIEIGHNLSGARATSDAPSRNATTAPTGEAAADTPAVPSPSGSALEERLKQRRIQQRGGK